MKKIRRVVTGHHPNGKSVIASDQEVEGTDVPGLPGATLTTLWGADETLSYPDDGTEPKHHAWFPPVGGFRFAAFVLAPEQQASEGNDQEPELPGTGVEFDHTAETERLFPGLLSTMKADDPGMHRSATIDALYIVSGSCVLELDDDSKTELHAGDVVVQSGTMHRWHNLGPEPCQVIAFLAGADLEQ